MCELRLVRISGTPPTSYFAIRHHDDYVGHCMLHHEAQASEHLPRDFTGNIYYDFLEEHRGMDHTKIALDKLVVAAKHIGLKEVYIVAPEHNLPPQEIIDGRRAQIAGTATGHDGMGYIRYKIELD